MVNCRVLGGVCEMEATVIRELGFGQRQRNAKNSRGVRSQSLCNEDNKDFLHAYEVHAAGTLTLGIPGVQNNIYFISIPRSIEI